MMVSRVLRAQALWFSLLLLASAPACTPEDETGAGDGAGEAGDGDGRHRGDGTNNGGNPDEPGEGSGTDDPGDPGDPGDPVDPVDPGSCGLGNVVGRVCAPNEQAWIGGATVEIFGTDCDGQPFELETLSDSGGSYSFGNVPSGLHQMRITKGSFLAELEVNVRESETTDLATSSEKSCLVDDDIQIAVITGTYDSIESILADVGVAHDVYSDFSLLDVSDAELFLRDPTALAEYDIVMINCGDHFFFFGLMDVDPTYSRRQIGLNLRNFVLSGGSLYASDMAYHFVEQAFPEMATFSDNEADYEAGLRGAEAPNLAADVVDTPLASALGQSNLTLHFDLQGWAVAQAIGPGAVALVRGDAPLMEGGTLQDVPLLITYQPTATSGRIFYTSFHNHAQLTADIQRVLQHVIFSL